MASCFRGIRERAPKTRVTFDVDDLDPSCLKIWEAFVTGASKADSHEGDALVAAEAFRARGAAPTALNDEGPVINLAAAAAMAVGFELEPQQLSRPCYVVRP